jgi:hypothetical protein
LFSYLFYSIAPQAFLLFIYFPLAYNGQVFLNLTELIYCEFNFYFLNFIFEFIYLIFDIHCFDCNILLSSPPSLSYEGANPCVSPKGGLVKKKLRYAQRGVGGPVRQEGIVHCSLFIVHCSLFIVHCSLFIVHCSLFIVHCSLRATIRNYINSGKLYKNKWLINESI